MSDLSAADMDRACLHPAFDAEIGVGRIYRDEERPDEMPDAFMAEIRVKCAACGEPFRWTGAQAGLRQDRPMVSVDETELRAPLRPASADPDFGLGIPGFSIGLRP